VTQIYVTFGLMYAREQHPRLPFAHPDGYLSVEGPDYRTALATACSLTGGAHAFDYAERPSDITYPRGELARVVVHDALIGEPS